MRQFRTLLAAMTALVLSACGGDSIQSPDFTSELVSLRIAPSTSSVAAGETVAFTAFGRYSLPPGSTPSTREKELGEGKVSWTSSTTSVATIDENGLATTLIQGSTQIQASLDGRSSPPATLTVTPPILREIEIDPPSATRPLGATQTFTARGVLSNGAKSPISVNWASSDTSVATISSASGITTTATGIAEGITTLTATTTNRDGETISQTASFTVGPFEPELISLEVSPSPGSQPVGIALQFTVTGTFTTEPGSPTPTTTGPVTDVVWSIANAAGQAGTSPVATIDAEDGIAIGQRIGRAVVTATSGDIFDRTNFNVTAPELVAISIAPADPSIPLGSTRVFTATGAFSDGTTGPISVNWATDDAGIASLSTATGASTTVTAEAEGVATVTASQSTPRGEMVSATTDVTVVAATLESLARIEPAIARVTPGRSVEFVAIGNFSDGSEAPIDDAEITWSSGALATATVNASGVATGVATGQTQITATLNSTSETATAVLTVTGQVCTTPLLATDGAVLTQSKDPLACLLCSFSNTANIIDANSGNFGTINVPLGVTGGDAAIRVTAVANPAYTIPFAAGSNTGFIVGAPAGTLLQTEVGSQLVVRTLRNGVVQQTTNTTPRLLLLGIDTATDSDTALVSIETEAPYDAVELTVNSGVASLLTAVRVFQACGTLELPVPATPLRDLAGIDPNLVALAVGATRNLVANGNFGTIADGTQAPVSDADLDWTSSDEAIATVDANGLVTGVAVGSATITATLKPGVTSTGLTRSAVATVNVVDDLCVTPLRASDGAAIESDVGGLCPLCAATNINNVIDDVTTNFSSLSVPLGLLRPTVSVTVTADEVFSGGDDAGFLIARPTGPLLQAEVGSRFRIDTLLDGVIQESTSPTVPLRVDLLGVGVDGAGDRALVTIPTTSEYDAVRLTFIGGLLSGGLQNSLTNVNVYQGCAATALPPAGPAP